MIIIKKFSYSTYVFNPDKVIAILNEVGNGVKGEWIDSDGEQELYITVPDTITANEIFILGMLVQSTIDN